MLSLQEFNVLDTQASELVQTAEMDELSVNIIWLFVTNILLGALLIVVIGLSISQRLSYRRQLRAAKIAAFGKCFSLESSQNTLLTLDSSSQAPRALVACTRKCSAPYRTRTNTA